MKRRYGAWFAVGFVFALSACEDEILTDVDLPKDAAADRGADAPQEGASSDAPPADSGPDEVTQKADGASAEGGDSAAPIDGSDAQDALDGSADAVADTAADGS